MATHSRQRMNASRLRVWWVTFFACAACVHVARAEPELALTWPVIEGCPQPAWIERRVGERLGRPLDDRAARSLHASAAIIPQGGGLTLALHVKQGEREGVRAISGASCDELAEAAVLVIALAIDPNALARAEPEPDLATSVAELPTARAPTPQEIKPSAAPTPPPQAAKSPRVNEPALRFRGHAGLALDAGSLPTVGLGPLAAIGYQWGRYRAEITGLWLAPRASSGGQGRVTVSVWAIAPTGCIDLVGRRAVLSTCAAVELGQAVGRGQQLEASLKAKAPHAAGSAALRLTVPVLANASLLAETSALAPFQRVRFVSLDTNDESPVALHESAKASLRARLAAELRF